MQPGIVLDFWFSEAARPHWFTADAGFDAEVRRRLLPLTDEAAAGAFAGWRDVADGALALCILLDQVPRNCHRGAAAAFAHDLAARDVARQAIDRGFDRPLGEERRIFLYLPFEHAEDMAAQLLSLALFRTMPAQAEWIRYAERHAEIVQRFGRFPHRNAALGRPTTAAEAAFLQEPMSSF